SKERGWPATTKHSVRAQLRPRLPIRATARGHLARGGARPRPGIGAAPARGQPVERRRPQRRRMRARRPPAREVPPECSDAYRRDSRQYAQRCRLRRGDDDGDQRKGTARARVSIF
ncbi:hypothetical protein GW17_00060005, partial [Ensete ventricosum]